MRASERVLQGLDQPDHGNDEQSEYGHGQAEPEHDVLDCIEYLIAFVVGVEQIAKRHYGHERNADRPSLIT